MEKLVRLQAVREAYENTSFWSVFKATYGVHQKSIQIPLWLCTASVLGLSFAYIMSQSLIVQGLMWASMMGTAIFSTGAKKIAFVTQYSEYSKVFGCARKNRWNYVRYLIFRDKLPSNLAGNEVTVKELKDLILSESELARTSVFSRHPVTVVCISFLTAILGGTASQLSSWSSGVMVVIVFVLLLILYFNYQVSEMIQGRDYKNRELLLFLSWLALDDSVGSKPDGA